MDSAGNDPDMDTDQPTTEGDHTSQSLPSASSNSTVDTSTPAHSAGTEGETAASSSPTHSVGRKQAHTQPSNNDSELIESSNDSDSASSPSDDDMLYEITSNKSASSPSDSEHAPGPSFAKGKAATPRLMPRPDARTLDQFKADVTARYQASLDKWDTEQDGPPPFAFTSRWFQHTACRPFVTWYNTYARGIASREAKDRRKRQAEEDDILGPMETSEATDADQPDATAENATPPNAKQPASSTTQQLHELLYAHESDLEDIEAPEDQEEVMEEEAQPLHAQLPPPSMVPSVKPAEKNPPKTSSPRSKGRSSSARAAPTHSVGPTTSSTAFKIPLVKKSEKPRQSVADIKRRGDTTDHSSRSSTGSKRSRDASSSSRHPPEKEARREIRPPTRSRSFSPNMTRHQDRVKNAKRRALVPLLDGYVSKEMAVYMATRKHTVENWKAHIDHSNKYELIGLICQLGVPASYLPVDYCDPTDARPLTPLANIIHDQLLLEKTLIPWDFVLGCTLGALPPYWRQCTKKTRKHLTKKLKESSTYRGFKVSAIGPVGFDLRGVLPNDAREYDKQRENMCRFARLADELDKPLVIVIDYDQEPDFSFSVHVDAIRALLEEDISPRQRIHLIVSKANAFELVTWLEEFPRTLFSFDAEFIRNVHYEVNRPDKDIISASYLNAHAMQDFLTYIPLEHIALHSGCPYPLDDAGRCKSPSMLKEAAYYFQLLTGTQADVLHANNAFNLVKCYDLDIRLLNYSIYRRDYRHINIGDRLPFDEFDAKICSLYSAAPKAVRIEQERALRRSLAEKAAAEAREAREARSRSYRRSRSSSKGRHSCRERSPSEYSSSSKHRSRKDRSSPTHSVGRKSAKERSSTQSSSRHSPVGRRDNSPPRLSRRQSPSRQGTSKGVIYLDEDNPQEMDFQPPEPVDHQKTVPIKLRDVKFPEEQRPSGSRFEGRLTRGGEALPAQLSVRDKINALNELYKNKPKPSVREELKNLRKKQAHTPTHSVGAAAYASASTPSDEPVTTVVRCPDMRLLKIPPEFELEMFPEELTVAELYTRTLPYLDGEPDPRTGLRGGPVAAVASHPLGLPQQQIFQVPHPGNARCPFHPDFECQDQNEDPVFHRTVSAFSLVTDGFWKNKKGIAKDKEMLNLLKEVKELKVRTLRQMMYIKFATRLRSNHKDRTPNALRFIHAVLTVQDPRRDLPILLQKHQPRFTDRLTTNAWPTEIDFRRALDHWSCYCVHAAIYVMNHLSGPIIWSPDWFQEPGFPVEVYKTFRMDIVDDGVNILHDLRQQFYRQYGLEHINAIAENRPEFVWRRFDDDEEFRVPFGLEFDQPITVFADQDTWNLYRYGLREGVEFILIDTTNMSSALHDVRQYFPGKKAKKVVFWFGLEYLHQDNCYGLALAVLCYHYTRFLGRIEQYAVMPPYTRSKRQLWATSVLGTFHQRQQIMPHARIATTPLDLRAWERDERELQQTGQLRAWDTTAMDEDGHLLTDELINAVKLNLVLNHGLDLWNAETGPSMMTLSRELSSHENAAPGQRHTSSAHGPFPKTASLAAQMPSTSGTGTGTHPVPNLDLDQVAAALATRLPGTNITREQLAEALASATSFVANRANTILDQRRSHSRQDKDSEPRK